MFSGAILQSGTSLAMWSIGKNARNAAFAIGKELNLSTTSSENLIAALRNVDAIQLQNAAFNVDEVVRIQSLPSQEHNSNLANLFLLMT